MFNQVLDQNSTIGNNKKYRKSLRLTLIDYKKAFDSLETITVLNEIGTTYKERFLWKLIWLKKEINTENEPLSNTDLQMK